MNTLGNNIPTDWARRYLFDGSGNSTNGTNNATITNGFWVKSERMYQLQCLSWGVSTTCTYASVTYTNSYIWIYSSGVWAFTKNSAKVTTTALNGVNGERYAGLTFFNRSLTAEEEQILRLEGLRQLGPIGIAKYPALLSGLVGYFRAEDVGGTSLYNLVDGITATRIGGTNTTDNLGVNKAISNPTYTWPSLTYTTGYTFENTGSGWTLVTTPAGLSATGINRTTTLRDIFLFSRTLSTDERNLLESLCNGEYPYPTPSYDLASLRDGLVLDLNEKGLDLSGNGNNGTLVGTPVVTRQGRAKGLSYNGSNQYAIIPDSSSFPSGGNFTINIWVNFASLPSSGNISSIINKYDGIANQGGYDMSIFNNAGTYRLDFGFNNSAGNGQFNSNNYSVSTGTLYMLTMKLTGTSLSSYVNGVLLSTSSVTGTPADNTKSLNIGRFGAYAPSSTSDFGRYTNGKIFSSRIRSRALSDREIQQLYYSQKGNFIY